MFKYKGGTPANSLNTYRSSISFFCSFSINISEDPAILRLFRYFYRTKPTRPKYFTFWPVASLLKFLSDWHPASSLSLKQLTLKTVALIALSSSDRGQTLHLLNIDKTHIDNEGLSFVIFDRLKTSKRNMRPHIVKCVTTSNPSLNVCDYTLSYMNRTLAIRSSHTAKGLEKPTSLFLSWKTKAPVAKNTIARWLKEVLFLAGIDTTQFSAHSYRGAGLSQASAKGASSKDILSAGDWTNITTFQSYYNAPPNNSPVGRLIIDSINE